MVNHYAHFVQAKCVTWKVFILNKVFPEVAMIQKHQTVFKATHEMSILNRNSIPCALYSLHIKRRYKTLLKENIRNLGCSFNLHIKERTE